MKNSHPAQQGTVASDHRPKRAAIGIKTRSSRATLARNLVANPSTPQMASAKHEDDGMKLLSEAEKKRSTKTGFLKSLFGSSANANEEAGELFVKAANKFKLAKAWTKCGDAFSRAAASYEATSDMQYEAASKHVDAAKAYKNVDVSKAVAAYEAAIRLHTAADRFQQCARFQREIGELREGDGDVEGALEAFGVAADFFDGEDATANANAMRVKMAVHCGSLGQYERAVEMFEMVAEAAVKNRLLRFGARDHLLRGGLCRCMVDAVGAQRALDKYRELDPSFPESREDELLQGVLKAMEEGDVEGFTDVVYKYDSISKLDEWKTSLLLKIKNGIRADEDDLT